MRIGRRPLFFTGLAAVCMLMLEPTPAEYRWVNLAAAGLAMLWAVLLFLEERSLVRWSPGAKDVAAARARRPVTHTTPHDPPAEG
ncbi:MAG: hypothetical protein ABI572_11360 [Actinomycetota bacterium]